LNQIKQQLYKYCQQWVNDKISLAQNEIKAAQASANEETKSSAGDKYETARAMAQLEIEKSTSQLAEAGKLKRMLGEFSGETETSKAQLGSLIQTNNGWFYISLSAGKVILSDVPYICLSPVSPLGAKMMNLVSGDKFRFNQVNYILLAVH